MHVSLKPNGSTPNQVSERSNKPQQLAHRTVAASALVVKTMLEDWSARHLMIIHPSKSLHLVKTVNKHGGASMRRGSRSIQPHGARARRSSVAERRAAKITSALGGVVFLTKYRNIFGAARVFFK
jgi:hypothetical protein